MHDLEGNLKVFEPIFVLQILNLAQATGELKLIIKDNEARVFFQNGAVIYAGIEHRHPKLGEYMVDKGLITQKKLDGLLIKKAEGQRLGDLLIEEGVVKEDVLRSAIIEQIKQVIYEIVRWHKGVFAFVNGREPYDQDILIDVPLDHLMLEGLKRMDEEREKV